MYSHGGNQEKIDKQIKKNKLQKKHIHKKIKKGKKHINIVQDSWNNAKLTMQFLVIEN